MVDQRVAVLYEKPSVNIQVIQSRLGIFFFLPGVVQAIIQ